MKIKRFFAADMRKAMAQIKEELGPDAVIMSNKKVTGGVEIVAAYEEADIPASSAPSVGASDPDVTISPRAAAMADGYAAKPVSGKTASASSSRSARNNAELASTLSDLLARQKSRAAGKSQSAESKQPAPETLAEQEPSARKKELAVQAANNAVIESMQEEISSIRQLLQSQLAGLMADDMARKEPVRAMLVKLLVKGGFDQNYASELAGLVRETSTLRLAWRELGDVLRQNLVVGNDDILRKGGAVALVGPTGVGKTTTIAKLAAHFAMKFGPDQVALVTADHFRIGAYEQLQTYGRIMGCAVKSLTDMSQMQDVLYQLRNRRLVLIDTAGMGQRDDRLARQLEELVDSCNINIHTYLALPATGQRRVLQEAYDRFGSMGLEGAILTKLDESVGIGDALCVCMQNQLPVCYATNGQRVPEDFETANAQKLVQMAMEFMEGDVLRREF